MKKLEVLKVRIFTEEFWVYVLIGPREDVMDRFSQYSGEDIESVRKDFKGCRGQAIDLIKDGKHPVIMVDGSLKWTIALATLAHEASHAMDYIERHIGIKDKSGEFHAHGIAAIMRSVKKLMR